MKFANRLFFHVFLFLACTSVWASQNQEPKKVVSSITPNSSRPGRVLRARVHGKRLGTVGTLEKTFEKAAQQFGSMKAASESRVLHFKALSVADDETSAEVEIVVDPRARPGVYTLEFADLDGVKIDFEVLPAAQRGYEDCPATFEVPADSGLGIACSQSLMSYSEAKDIFGNRIANTYLVVEVNVRNLNEEFEYLLHSVRLGWDSVASTTRDKRLVRGVAEKGQGLDPRNVLVRGIQSAGTVLGGIAVLPNIATGFKDFSNLFQGPVREAVEHFFPDFTIEQLNRLNDSAFGYQTLYIPQKSSISAVAFLPQSIYLDKTKRKQFKKQNDDLLDYQRRLVVQVAGAHVREVNTETPTATSVEPTSAAKGSGAVLRFTGAHLDRARTLRFSHSGTNVDTPLDLIDQDPSRAMAKLPGDLAVGSYNLLLIAADGEEFPTSLSFEVLAAPSPGPRVREARVQGAAVRGQSVTVIFEGDNLGSITKVEAVYLDDAGKQQVEPEDQFTVTLKEATQGLRAAEVKVGAEARLHTHYWRINDELTNLVLEVEDAQSGGQ